MLSNAKLILAAFLLVATVMKAQQPAHPPQETPPVASPAYAPSVAPASDEAQRAIASFKLDEGWTATLWAAEPLLANPVVFSAENPFSVLVCETWRQADKGVPDNRDHPQWLNDDLAAQTVSDRTAYYVKHYPKTARTWATEHDRLVRVEDRDGDGRAETTSVFADGFKNLADGTGSGVLNIRGNVYYTCIPDLWRLRDNDGDGRAEERDSLGYGFGVRTALRGHDMHGLILGPDGRIYWSIGDRGYNLTTREGKELKDPGSGAVFRCFPDGSGMEVVHTGLRNPQELAFDDHFNLFTGDNNSDHEDRMRIVQIVEGGETGWRMNFQTLGDRGPWVAEGWWKQRFDGQAAFLIPTINSVGSGPSGFSYSPGTGMPEKYRGVFLLADFLGGRTHSGIRAFRLGENGAGFRMTEDWHLVRGLLPTDVEYGPDGKVWISDWVDGWTGVAKGRIYRLTPPGNFQREILETSTLLSRDLFLATTAELELLLAHADRRVRLQAHSALAARGAQAVLLRVAATHDNALARIHGVFGLWQMGLADTDVSSALQQLLGHADAEVRAAAARVAGDLRIATCATALRGLLEGPERTAFFAAIALGRLADADSADALIALAERNNDADALLRHAARMGLAGCCDSAALRGLKNHASVAVRRAALLALRRQRAGGIAVYLNDADPALRLEAACAIYDLPILAAFPALADQLAKPERHNTTPRLLWRAVAAAAHLGRQQDLHALAAMAAHDAGDIAVRKAALDELVTWNAPFFRERVLNEVRERSERVQDAAEMLLVGVALAPCIKSGNDDLARAAAEAAAKHWSPDLGAHLLALASSRKHTAATRMVALKSLNAHGAATPEFLAGFLQEKAPELRSGAAGLLIASDPQRALPLLDRAMQSTDGAEAQAAVRAVRTVASLATNAMLEAALVRADKKEFAAAAILDLVEAADARGGALQQHAKAHDAGLAQQGGLGTYALCLEGGDIERGRKLFLEKTETSCTRCHLVKGMMPAEGFRAGPELTKIALQRDRVSLLQSIVSPSAVISDGWTSVNLETREEGVISGRLMKEDAEGYDLELGDTGVAEKRRVLKKDVLSRYGDSSAMPADLVQKLTRHELRDIVAFLASLK